MTYQVQVYCHTSFYEGTCQHVPSHPFVLPELFDSIRAANDKGGEFVARVAEEQVEWEVLDSTGKVVC